MRSVPWIAPGDEDTPFPHPDAALDEPNGLLAIGGSLSPGRLVRAYESGIFPWFAEDQPVLWWSPDPRAIIQPGRIHVSRSLRKRLRHGGYTVTLDREFSRVIRACAEPRTDGAGTWITDSMLAAYETLHAQGIAHSAEVWRDGALVGGLYGVSLGAGFFGESMFSRCNDASKVALVRLSEQLQAWGFTLIDCQLPTDHLLRLGAEEWPRRRFLDALAAALRHRQARAPWRFHGPTPLFGGAP